MLTVLILALAFSFIGSFFCSLSEASFYSVPGNYVERLIKEGKSAGMILKRLRHDVQKPISAILIVNTLANSAGAAVAGAAAAEVLGARFLTAFTLIFVILLFIVSEYIPKTAGVAYSRTLSVWIARPLQLLVWILSPIIWGCMLLTRILLRGKKQEHTISAEELVVMARLGHEHGVIDEHEVAVIENILDMADESTRSIMTPRAETASLSLNTTMAEARSMGEIMQHGEILVRNENTGETVGLVFRRQILNEIARDRPGTTVGELMRPAHFIADSTTLDVLLKSFLESHQPLFIVLDQSEREVGLVTLEDVIEEILGKDLGEVRNASGKLLGEPA